MLFGKMLNITSLSELIAIGGAGVAIVVAIWLPRIKIEHLEERLREKDERRKEEEARAKEERERVESQLSKLWKWKDEYEHESHKRREKIYEDIGTLRGELAKRDGQYTEITTQIGILIGMVQRVENRLDARP